MPSSTIPLSRTLAVTQQFVRNSPLTFTSPTTDNDPGFTNADWVRQFLLGPPFAWRWNRTNTPVTCEIGVSDYTIGLPNFGWLEKAVIFDPEDGDRSHELTVLINLVPESVPNLPVNISAQDDDGEGNITFRLSPTPDKAYALKIVSQNAPPLFQNTSDTWAPIPDYLSFLYTQGMRAQAYEYLNDPRFITSMQIFMQQAVAANNGLSESQKSIFLPERLNMVRQQADVQATVRK